MDFVSKVRCLGRVIVFWVLLAGPFLFFADETDLCRIMAREEMLSLEDKPLPVYDKSLLRTYIRELDGYSLPSREEEQEWFMEYEQQKSKKAFDKIIKHHLRFVVSLAKRYKAPGLDLLDLIQEGNLGLIKAMDNFDYRRGNVFATYAKYWIRNEISRFIQEQKRIIHLPSHILQSINKMRGVRKKLFREPWSGTLRGRSCSGNGNLHG